MKDLAEKKCIPCEGGVPAFDTAEIHKYLKKVDGWDVLQDSNKNYFIEKKFKWSGQRDLNPRPSRWQRDALPLSYARVLIF